MFRLKLDQLKSVRIDFSLGHVATIGSSVDESPLKHALIVSKGSHTTCVIMAITQGSRTFVRLGLNLHQTTIHPIIHLETSDALIATMDSNMMYVAPGSEFTECVLPSTHIYKEFSS